MRKILVLKRGKHNKTLRSWQKDNLATMSSRHVPIAWRKKGKDTMVHSYVFIKHDDFGHRNLCITHCGNIINGIYGCTYPDNMKVDCPYCLTIYKQYLEWLEG